jgi:hypothetical protein
MDPHDYLFSGFRNAARELKKQSTAIIDEHLPIRPDEWNLHQIASHVRDVNAEVYLPRLKRIVAEENPSFEDFDADLWMATHYDAEEGLDDILTDFTVQCEEAAGWLEDLNYDEWDRPGTHPTLGTHSLAWWADRMLTHIEEHLAQIREE